MKQDSRASVGKSTKIVGRVNGVGDLVVEGRIEGEVSIKGQLHVGENGAIVSDAVEATELTVEGNVRGDVSAPEGVTLRAGSELRGAITTGRIAIEDGARYAGAIEMNVELPAELAR